MKVIDNINKKDMQGSVKVEAEEEDDMYRLFNIIAIGDIVEATTIRNVVFELKSGNSKEKNRIQTKIAIRVEKIGFDGEQCSLRLNGKNVKESEHIKLGQYHTLELEIHRSIRIEKTQWDSLYLEALDEAKDPSKNAEVVAIVMQEGIANICLIHPAVTKTAAKIERAIPKKRQGNQQYEKALQKFFQDVYKAAEKNINFEVAKIVLVGSPGFWSEEFLKYLFERAGQDVDSASSWGSVVLRNRAKFVRAHTSCGFKKAIDEMLGSDELISKMGDVKAADEVRALQGFYDMLSSDPDRACYGFAEVRAASEQLAVHELLITDSIFRCSDFNERKKYLDLMEAVQGNGGRVLKFSSMHVSGEQLNMYTGVAATLRFPLPEAESEQDDDSDSDSDSDGAGQGGHSKHRDHDIDHEIFNRLMLNEVPVPLPSHISQPEP